MGRTETPVLIAVKRRKIYCFVSILLVCSRHRPSLLPLFFWRLLRENPEVRREPAPPHKNPSSIPRVCPSSLHRGVQKYRMTAQEAAQPLTSALLMQEVKQLVAQREVMEKEILAITEYISG